MSRKFYQKFKIKDFDLSPFKEDCVKKERRQLSPVRSQVWMEFHQVFLKDGADILSKPITYIVNLSITSGIVPDDMTIDRICPIF